MSQTLTLPMNGIDTFTHNQFYYHLISRRHRIINGAIKIKMVDFESDHVLKSGLNHVNP